MMYGQMTAGSWIYIGSQGIVQGTYETFVEMGRQHFGGNLAASGSSPRGSAAWAARSRSPRRWPAPRCSPSNAGPSASRSGSTRATSTSAADVARRGARAARARAQPRVRKPISVGLLGNAADVLPELLRRGVRPDAVTDQTSAHDPVNGYLPAGWTLEQWDRLRAQRPAAARRSGGAAVDGDARRRRCSSSSSSASPCSTTATTSARSRSTKASRTPSPSRVSCRRTCGRCSAAASVRSAGPRCPAIPRTSTAPTQKVKELIPDDRAPASLARHGARAHPVPGPAGAHLLGGPRRTAPARPRVQRDGARAAN